MGEGASVVFSLQFSRDQEGQSKKAQCAKGLGATKRQEQGHLVASRVNARRHQVGTRHKSRE